MFPHSYGEYPVLTVDVDDMPYVGINYPGFDVYLADAADLLTKPTGMYEYTWLSEDATYRARVAEHAGRVLGGNLEVEFPGPPFDELPEDVFAEPS